MYLESKKLDALIRPNGKDLHDLLHLEKNHWLLDLSGFVQNQEVKASLARYIMTFMYNRIA